MIFIIVAYCRETRVIGLGGVIPWKLPLEMTHFKKTTTGHCVILGRNTFESIGSKPLKNRTNIIVSKTLSGDFIRPTLEEALALGTSLHEKVYVIGGEQIYKEVLGKNLADEVLASEIKKHYDGDVFFPLLTSSWQEEVIRETEDFDIVLFRRQK